MSKAKVVEHTQITKKRFYDRKLWSKREKVKDAVTHRNPWITEEEYTEITGEQYNEGMTTSYGSARSRLKSYHKVVRFWFMYYWMIVSV